MSELLDLSATRLAALLRQGALSPVELVEAHIQRIEAVNPLLNALVQARFELARAEAREAEHRLRREEPASLPPFLGVPCTIKEFFAVQGLPQTGGILARRDHRPEADAPTVARLRAAGFIPLGVSNNPEGGLWLETHNLVYGRTNNPWDLGRTCGGSSGGEGALVASGCSPVGLGSDIGGSIRIPAAFCGTVGHKPSGGLVPNSGQFPDLLDGTGAFLSSGPLVRRVEDLFPLLRVLAGPDGRDPHCVAMPLRDPAEVELAGLRVIPVEENGRTRVDDSLRQGLRRAAAALEAQGARLQEVRVERLRHAIEIWSTMLGEAASVPYTTILGQGRPIGLLHELGRALVGRPRHSKAALVVAGSEVLADLVPSVKRRFLAEGQALRQQLDALLGEDGVLLHPPYSRPAPRHGEPWNTPFDFGMTAIFNVMQCAVTVVPVGFDSRGLPLAVQIVARQGMDHLAIAAAGAVERALGGWRRAEPRPRPDSRTWTEVQAARRLAGKEPLNAP